MNKSTGFLFFLLVTLNMQTQAAETDWLELQPGFEGKTLGAKLEKIEVTEGSSEQTITVSIPTESIKDKPLMEEVIVTGKKPDDVEINLPFTYEWAKDYDKNYYGLIIKLKNDAQYPIRIYFKADQDTPLP